MTRKKSRLLAAIMFTDMVGSTALMRKDEQKAKQNRYRHRKILQNSGADHQGKILQYYGDGVNVASRIEGLAVFKSILISGKVFDEIKNRQAFSTKYLGTFDLKNVDKPLEVYAIANEGLEIEPDFALAYSKLLVLHIYLGASGKKPMQDEFTKAKEYARKTIQLDERAAEKAMPASKAAFFVSLLYATMDNLDEMYYLLNKSVEIKDNNVVYILCYSEFRKYRQDPRFVEIVKKIGLWK